MCGSRVLADRQGTAPVLRTTLRAVYRTVKSEQGKLGLQYLRTGAGSVLRTMKSEQGKWGTFVPRAGMIVAVGAFADTERLGDLF